MTHYEAYLLISSAAAEHIYHLQHMIDPERQRVLERQSELLENAMEVLDEAFNDPSFIEYLNNR